MPRLFFVVVVVVVVCCFFFFLHFGNLFIFLQIFFVFVNVGPYGSQNFRIGPHKSTVLDI